MSVQGYQLLTNGERGVKSFGPALIFEDMETCFRFGKKAVKDFHYATTSTPSEFKCVDVRNKNGVRILGV
jgi:hypothetical protein